MWRFSPHSVHDMGDFDIHSPTICGLKLCGQSSGLIVNKKRRWSKVRIFIEYSNHNWQPVNSSFINWQVFVVVNSWALKTTRRGVKRRFLHLSVDFRASLTCASLIQPLTLRGLGFGRGKSTADEEEADGSTAKPVITLIKTVRLLSARSLHSKGQLAVVRWVYGQAAGSNDPGAVLVRLSVGWLVSPTPRPGDPWTRGLSPCDLPLLGTREKPWGWSAATRSKRWQFKQQAMMPVFASWCN